MCALKNLKVGIVGATGYTGVELLRLLAAHPSVTVTAVTSESARDQAVTNIFPSLTDYADHTFIAHDHPRLKDCDLVFFATPHGSAMHHVPALLDRGVRVIDLSADFRLRDVAVWEKWYGLKHVASERLSEAVFGLPELHRQALKDAQLVAVAGCYSTAIILGLLPLIANKLVVLDDLIADAKSGVSGAGRNPAVTSLFSEVSENFNAYAVTGHRHLPEICQALSWVAKVPVELTFVPHLLPMIRGIFATLYTKINTDFEYDAIRASYENYYADEPFVTLLTYGVLPSTRSIRGTNHCRIALCQPQGGGQIVVLSVIDNLVKGAAGQAIQCMNIMLGWDETTALKLSGVYP